LIKHIIDDMWESKFGKIKKKFTWVPLKQNMLENLQWKQELKNNKKLSKKKSLYYQYKEWCEINYLNQ